MSEQQVLCITRRCVEERQRFTPWRSADWLFQAAESGMCWLSRSEAEASNEFIQPIPCALVLGENDGYYVFRRVKEGRADLSARLSLVVGGHIDWMADAPEFPQLVRSTLTREISEELCAAAPSSITPIGLVVDHTSVESSRHVGIVHEVMIEGPIRPLATEEFSVSSSYIGRPYSTSELSARRGKLDPWSAIIFGDYLAPSYALDIGAQPRLL